MTASIKPTSLARAVGRALRPWAFFSLTSLMAGAAFAQSASDSNTLEEIVVTAQFREQKLQDTPIAITAVSEELMRARGQDAIFQVTQQAPNVQIKKSSSVYGAAVHAFIRGIGQQDYNFALEPGVGMYIDDVYFPTMTGSAFEMVDLERVEILRGPQGTLQGRNAIGGSVRLITKKPTGEGGGYAEVVTGRFDRIGLKGAADMKLADNLFLRISGLSNSQDGYVDRLDFACAQPTQAATLGITSSGIGKANCKLGTLGGQSYTAGRATLRWVASDNIELNLIGDITNDHSEASAMVLLDARNIPAMGPQWGPWFNVKPGGYYTYETFTDPTSGFNPVVGFNRTPYSTPPINYLNNWGGALTIDWTLTDNLKLKSITSHRDLQNDFATAHDGSPLDGETGFNALRGHSFQQEIHLNGSVNTLADYTVGVFYFTQTNEARNRIDLGYVIFPGAFDFISKEVADTTAKAAFLHTVWHLTDSANVTAGIRYSDEEKTQTLARLNPGDGGMTFSPLFAALAPSGYAPPVKSAATRFDWRLSADYRFNDSLMAYATASTGFKSGGVSPRFFFASHITPFGPEEAITYEAGVKSDLVDNRVRINAALFRSDYKDQQVGAPGSVCPWLTPPAPCLAIINGQDSQYQGAELEITAHPTTATAIELSASYIDAKYTRISPLTLSNPNFIRDPAGPPGIPQYKWSAGVQHTFELAGGGTLTPRIGYDHEDERAQAVRNLMNTPAINIVNARVAWQTAGRDWEVAASVNNLTDEYYMNNIFDISAFGGWTAAQPGKPREWALTIRRTF